MEPCLTWIDSQDAYVIGGQVFINTSLLLGCHSRDQVACVLASELAHIMCDHPEERETGMLFWRFLAQCDGRYKDLRELSRVQEFEADYIGLFLMASSGYDPQSAVEYMDYNILAEGSRGAPDNSFSHPCVSTPDQVGDWKLTCTVGKETGCGYGSHAGSKSDVYYEPDGSSGGGGYD